MKKVSLTLDFAANILIVVVSIVVIGMLIQRYYGANPQAKPEVPEVGKRLAVKDVEWMDDKKNVVIALQKGCRFCEASVDFYKRLLSHPRKDSVNFVAVFPAESTDIENYIAKLGIPRIPVRLNAFDSLGIEGTPTIVITNGKGEVIKTWRGKLSPDRENEVMNYLNAD